MKASHHNGAGPAPRSKPLTQAKLARLVARFKEKRTLKSERYRDLVRCGFTSSETPKAFAERLRQAKLEVVDVRTITRILCQPHIAKRFSTSDLDLADALKWIRQGTPVRRPSRTHRASPSGKTSPPLAPMEELCENLSQFPHWKDQAGEGDEKQHLDCGLFTLTLIKNSPRDPRANDNGTKPAPFPNADDQWFRIFLTPEAGESLTEAARFSGLTSPKVARELLSRKSLVKFHRLLQKISPAPTQS